MNDRLCLDDLDCAGRAENGTTITTCRFAAKRRRRFRRGRDVKVRTSNRRKSGVGNWNNRCDGALRGQLRFPPQSKTTTGGSCAHHTSRVWSVLSPIVSITFLCLCAAVVGPLQASDSLVILPSKIKLTGPAARQQLLVEQFRDGHFAGQLTNRLDFASSNPNVVKIENGAALPVTNGQATLTVKSGSQSAKVEVAVEGMEKPSEWSFRNHVQPVLAKAGCSSGACHGAAAGQNGFKLSLRGYDDESDFLALTRQSLGRRIVPADPGRSLMLLKPTGAVPHKGGKRFEVDSIDYQVLSDWIASGTPGPKADEPRLERIEFL